MFEISLFCVTDSWNIDGG